MKRSVPISKAGHAPTNIANSNSLQSYLSEISLQSIECSRSLAASKYSGTIPAELAGGEYVRNGRNPVMNEMQGRDAHWLDGDGVLSGVIFRSVYSHRSFPSITPPALQTPTLPSIATPVNPLCALITVTLWMWRILVLVTLSHLPGSQQAIKNISVANTAVIFHHGRALATCESGLPIRISLSGLETVGWFDGVKSKGEIETGSGTRFGIWE